VYIVARELFDGRVAAFAALFFATSHYLMSYAHTGYDNIFAITPFAWCVALAVVGLRRASPGWMYAAGIVGGLGFYTFPTARMAPIVVVAFIATLGPRGWKPATLVPLALGLAVAGLPLFATDGWDAISVSRDRTVFGFTDHPTEGVRIRIIENIPRTLLGFNYNRPRPLRLGIAAGPDRGRARGARARVESQEHFAAGAPAARAVARRHAGLLRHPLAVRPGRLRPSAPGAAGGGGVRGDRGGRTAAGGGGGGAAIAQAAPPSASSWRAAPLLAYLNLQRFLVDSPKVIPSTEERGLGGRTLMPDAAPAIAIIRTPAPLLAPALVAYGWDDWVTHRPVPEAMGADDYRAYGCAVVTVLRNPHPQEVSGEVTRTCHESCWREATTTVERLEQEFGFRRVASVTQGTAHFGGGRAFQRDGAADQRAAVTAASRNQLAAWRIERGNGGKSDSSSRRIGSSGGR
jgi:hypothetical protein